MYCFVYIGLGRLVYTKPCLYTGVLAADCWDAQTAKQPLQYPSTRRRSQNNRTSSNRDDPTRCQLRGNKLFHTSLQYKTSTEQTSISPNFGRGGLWCVVSQPAFRETPWRWGGVGYVVETGDFVERSIVVSTVRAFFGSCVSLFPKMV